VGSHSLRSVIPSVCFLMVILSDRRPPWRTTGVEGPAFGCCVFIHHGMGAPGPSHLGTWDRTNPTLGALYQALALAMPQSVPKKLWALAPEPNGRRRGFQPPHKPAHKNLENKVRPSEPASLGR
jgi:hypothetical protein